MGFASAQREIKFGLVSPAPDRSLASLLVHLFESDDEKKTNKQKTQKHKKTKNEEKQFGTAPRHPVTSGTPHPILAVT